ncbi:hypothetical protein BIW11_04894 [Tropilaelaps mercedesae]|uniref:Uncharacterized protein n=1 Tax=Tropilaelaps mercedesae TaxID=418985 RepID=A0A1V9X0I9_9ACAR|nr:hypothetical protein BIW11_04894 [Tropilaelaps mercedesae]
MGHKKGHFDYTTSGEASRDGGVRSPLEFSRWSSFAGVPRWSFLAGVLSLEFPAGVLPLEFPAGVPLWSSPAGVLPLEFPSGVLPLKFSRWSSPLEFSRWSSPTGILPLEFSRWSSPLEFSRWSSPTGVLPLEFFRWSSPAGVLSFDFLELLDLTEPLSNIAGICRLSQQLISFGWSRTRSLAVALRASHQRPLMTLAYIRLCALGDLRGSDDAEGGGRRRCRTRRTAVLTEVQETTLSTLVSPTSSNGNVAPEVSEDSEASRGVSHPRSSPRHQNRRPSPVANRGSRRERRQQRRREQRCRRRLGAPAS